MEYARDVRRYRQLLLGALLVGLAILGCDSGRLPAQASNDEVLEFDFAGCTRVRAGAICELDSSRVLRLWVEGNEAPELFFNRQELKNNGSRSVGGGQAASFVIPAGTYAVTVRAGPRQGVLKIAPSSEAKLLTEAKQLRNRGEWLEAKQLLKSREASLPLEEAGRARALLARIQLSQDEVGEAVKTLTATSREALEQGLLSESAYDALALAFTLTFRQRDYAAARQWLHSVRERSEKLPEVRALLPYYRGLLEAESGHPREALLFFREATLLADRLGMSSESALARQELARLQHRLGRRQDALRTHQRLIADSSDTSHCVRLSRLLTLSWFQLLSEDPEVQAGASTSLREVGEALGSCPNPRNARDHRLNLTYHALQQHRLHEAETQLNWLSQTNEGKTTRLAMWEALFRSQLEEEKGNPRKSIHYAQQAKGLADAAGWPEQGHAAWVAQAVAFEKLNEQTLARNAYEEAERLADHLVRLVPLGEGQQLFALQLERSAEGLISLHLDAGRPRKAFEVAAQARRRLLLSNWRSSRIDALEGESLVRWETAIAEYRAERARIEVESVNDWQLPKDELLATRAARELSLQRARNALGTAYTVLEPADTSVTTSTTARQDGAPTLLITRVNGHWLAFLEQGNALTVQSLGPLSESSSSDRWGAALLPIFERLVGGIQTNDTPKQLRVALHPQLANLDVHALEFDQRPLLSYLPVSYVLEIDSRSVRDPEPPAVDIPPLPLGTQRAPIFSSLLVVGDPTEDLPRARAEAEFVTQTVNSTQKSSLYGDEANKGNVLRMWSGVSLFHFSGHARPRGVDGMRSYLKLAGGTRLELADALALAVAPKHAVLVACESAAGRNKSGGGMNLSFALIAAGTRTVVAPSRSVSDTLSQRFVRALYGALTDTHAQGWAVAVQQASLQIRSRHPTSDWSSFRALTLN